MIKALILNAVKFTKTNETPDIQIQVKEMESGYRFTISDNGIGMAPEFHEKSISLFFKDYTPTPFMKEMESAYLKSKKSSTFSWRRKIWIDSEEGKGSKFYFYTIPKGPN